MSRPLIADLLCGAGGAAMGLHRAGFNLVGFDTVKQPRYPFDFVQQDALTVKLDGFDAVWASPPCQAYSTITKGTMSREVASSISASLPMPELPARPGARLSRSHGEPSALSATRRHGMGGSGQTVRLLNGHPDYLEPVRELVATSNRPFVIENVSGAPLQASVMLCGSMFGLPVWRHRWFESNVLMLGPRCVHAYAPVPIDVTGTGGPGGRSRKPSSIAHARECLGIDWMTRSDLSQAIPPAYSEYLGRQLLQHMEANP